MLTCNRLKHSTIGSRHIWIGIIPRRHGNDEIDDLLREVSPPVVSLVRDLAQAYNLKSSLKVIRFLVTEEVADDQDGQDEQSDHKDLEVQVHRLSHGPADDDD